MTSCSFLGMNIPDSVKKQLKGNYVFKDSGLLRGIQEYSGLIKRTMSDTETVICYNIAYAWLILPLMAKRRHKRSIVIVADYSETKSCTTHFHIGLIKRVRRLFLCMLDY